MSDATRRLAEQVQAAQALTVTARVVDGEVLLVVDARALMKHPHQPREWWLHPADDGRWSHPPSGTFGPLAEILRGIAAAYLIDEAGT